MIMAKSFKILSLLLTISLATTITAQSQGPVSAPESAASPGMPALNCTNALLNMSACLTYVEEGSNLTMPEKGCCPSLSSLVNDNPICLCQFLANGDTFGIKIDTTKALMLPTACKVDTPPVSLCSAVGIPVASPMDLSPAPAGGPEEPGSNPTTIASGMAPTAAPPPNTNTGTRATATSMAPLTITLFIISLL